MDWKLADAKNRFSELVTEALTNGPQRVTRRDQAVIIISEQAYEELIGTRPSFIDFLLNGPDFSKLDLTRDESLMRDIKL